MQKLDLKAVPKLKPNPLFKGLPKDLKNPKRFEEIEKQLIDIMKSDHTHKTVKGFVTCAWCQKNMKLKQEMIQKLGFKSYGQYAEWRKIMVIIKNKSNFQLR